MAETTNQTPHTRTASYLADPSEVGRVLLLYSGGLDTSVMLKWIADEYEAEVVTLTVNLGQPGEDYDVIEGKARRIGAVDCYTVDAREEFARDFVLPAIKANALYGGGYPLFTALGRPLIAKLAVGVRAQYRLRHDRPRLHRQGQRPGAHRGHDRHARPRAEGHRARPRLADGPRRGDRLRAKARDPGQGRHRDHALLDRRQPLGPLLGGALDRGPLARARRRRLPARHPARAGARRAADRRRSPSSSGVPVAVDGERMELVRADRARRRDRLPPRRRHRRPHRGPHRRPEGARHLRGAGGDDHPARPRRSSRSSSARSTRTSSSPRSTASGPTSSTPVCGGSRCAATSTRSWTASTSRSPVTIGVKLYKGSARVVTRESPYAVYDAGAGVVRRVRRAVLPAGVAGLHRAVVAAVADGLPAARGPQPDGRGAGRGRGDETADIDVAAVGG